MNEFEYLDESEVIFEIALGHEAGMSEREAPPLDGKDPSEQLTSQYLQYCSTYIIILSSDV
jgi:hypothetical protein